MQGRITALVAALASLALAPAARAETLTVTGTGDQAGACQDIAACPSVRSALARAEADPGADTIVLPAGDTQLQEALTVDSDVTITGRGAGATILHAGENARVFEVIAGTTATISHLTMRDGTADAANNHFGGNLTSAGTLTLDHVRVTNGHGNSGGGVANRGGTMTIVASLIDGNVAPAEPGNGGDAGAILNFGGDGPAATLVVRDSTLAFNTARLAAAVLEYGNAADSTRLERVTIAGNTTGDRGGGVIAGSAPVHVSGSLIAANTAQVAPADCGNGVVDDGGNVEDGADCPFPARNADVRLATELEDLGGETPVLAFGAGSAALDAAGVCGPASDQRDVARPQGTACDAGAFELEVAAVETPPQATPTPAPAVGPQPVATPTPVSGRSVVAAPVSGSVLVKKPGAKGFVTVDSSQGIPLGSTVDTRKGVVQITGVGGVAKFYDGLFKVTQSGKTTVLTLTEALAPCSRKAAAAAKKKPRTRKLWGNGSGSFSTRGQYSAATVRGTRWLVQDSCAGTLTRVATGVVSVRDSVKRKTVLLRAPHSYTARPKRKP